MYRYYLHVEMLILSSNLKTAMYSNQKAIITSRQSLRLTCTWNSLFTFDCPQSDLRIGCQQLHTLSALPCDKFHQPSLARPTANGLTDTCKKDAAFVLGTLLPACGWNMDAHHTDLCTRVKGDKQSSHKGKKENNNHQLHSLKGTTPTGTRTVWMKNDNAKKVILLKQYEDIYMKDHNSTKAGKTHTHTEPSCGNNFIHLVYYIRNLWNCIWNRRAQIIFTLWKHVISFHFLHLPVL